MKILALEIEKTNTNGDQLTHLLQPEAQRVWELYQSGIFREIYFTREEHQAVIILECEDLHQAESALSSLPLVKAGVIDFQIFTLDPYTGFGRLFA